METKMEKERRRAGAWRGRGGRSISCATAATLSLSADFRRDHQTIERDTHHRLPARATGADSSQPYVAAQPPSRSPVQPCT